VTENEEEIAMWAEDVTPGIGGITILIDETAILTGGVQTTTIVNEDALQEVEAQVRQESARGVIHRHRHRLLQVLLDRDRVLALVRAARNRDRGDGIALHLC